ncbi:polyamine-transporting ATPase 13A3-like [Euwallacea similis]|uniref:polyamine-transporting ATPase 13A3-like n=1 Tax=Euwallacea similis TaxID=1736056 RepID=UPI00344C47BC
MSFVTLPRSGYSSLTNATTYQDIYNEKDEELLCRIYGYKESHLKSFFYHLFSILLVTVPYFIFNSYPQIRCYLKCTRCDITEAEFFLVRDRDKSFTIQKVCKIYVNLPHVEIRGDIKYFFHQHTRYVWIPDRGAFGTLFQLLWSHKTCDNFVDNLDGLTEADHTEMFNLYGPNKIEVEIKSYWKLFIEEVFNPFYVFQVFSVILWCLDDYLLYAGCVVVLTLFSSITSLIQTRKQSQNLHDTVESSKCHEVTVLRRIGGSDECLKIDPEELVPGDLIVMPAADYIMPCDAVLLTGQSIVNESVLTGESVPETKTALLPSSEIYSADAYKRHTLFSGTSILQTRYYGGKNVLARVVRTGFDTTKGNLVKSILFPTPVSLQFHKDAFKFVFVLFVLAFSGMAYCIYLYIRRHASMEDIFIRSLDIVTIVVPPALPAAMTIGTVYSHNRLKKLKIYCISPPRINVCGKIKLACFDKTGTLTHDGLTMSSVVQCENASFFDPVTSICHLEMKSRFVQGMACCHSLTRIGGKLNGDPLDLNMFEFTKWELEEPGMNENTRFDMLAPTVVKPPKKQVRFKIEHEDVDIYDDQDSSQIGLIREFSFSSTVQCMSVICKDLENPNMFCFTKGAPEKLYNLCLPQSLPMDFQSRLGHYTTQGYRVIALAYKELPVRFKWKDAQKAKRDKIECELNFLGFLILQNPLKSETVPVIRDLHKALIRTVMVTGDNIMTAISVARDCGMVDSTADIYILSVTEQENINEIPSIVIEKAGSGVQPDVAIVDIYNNLNCHFAIDGKTWSKLKTHYEYLIADLLVRTTVFARFQPDQKTRLVTSFQDLDYVVSMVGDGANDCGALKAAHVGVSLSPAEASVAAPFTSGIPNISCLIWLILEGRCALVTSFSIFKYMALYSLIQFTTILILYTCHSILGNYQFLFIDLIITTSLAVTMGRQGPSKTLHSKRPMSSLVSPKNLFPLILQIITCAAFQLGALYYLHKQKWFEPIKRDTHEEVIESWENTILFTVSCHQYVILAWHLSKGKPYRQVVFKNFWFVLNVLILTAFITWMMLNPCKKFAEIMELIYVKPNEVDKIRFKLTLLALPAIHFIIADFIEILVFERSWIKRAFQCIFCKNKPRNKYKQLLQKQDFHQYLQSLQSLTISSR